MKPLKDDPAPIGKGKSIRFRFGMGVGLLLFLIAAVAATGYFSLNMSRHAANTMQDSQEIQRLVLEMDRGMERAHRLHGDFFLHFPEIGFAAAHEQYAQPAVRQIAQVISLSDALRKRIAHSAVNERLRQRQVDLNLYLSFARRFADTSIDAVELLTTRSASQSGLEAQLDRILEALAAATDRSENLARLFSSMKAHIQDYRIARERFLMQSAFNLAFSLRETTKNDPTIPGDRQREIGDLLNRMTGVAEQILAVDAALKSRFNDFALQSAAVDEVSRTLIRLARESVEDARQAIRRTHRTASIVMLLITLSGLAAAVSVAGFLNRSITRRVIRLTRSADELRKGNLDVFTVEDTGDELGRLAVTFNLMAGRIRELVDGLELKVNRRTAELAASERRFRQLFEHSSSGIVVYTPCADGQDYIIKDCNHAVEVIEQLPREQMTGRRLTEVFPGIHDFGLLPVMQRVRDTGKPGRHPVSFYSDERIRGWRANTVYKLPSGEIVAVYDDCTEQKRIEIEKQAMAVKLQRAQKMEALGLMAGGVAHDLNNILSGIVGYPELLLMSLPEDSELRAPIRTIQESGRRAAAVVSDLLTVARGIASKKETVGLNDLVQTYLDSPEHRKLASLHPHIRCVPMLAEDLRPIACSPIHINKCIMNLVANGMESMETHGQVAVATRSARIDDQMALQNRIRPGDYAVLSVSDNGSGIAKKDLEHIFEPFYSKKILGISGTGLGLTIVWNSVVDHGGMVLVDSGDNGTTFSLYFPMAVSPTGPAADASGHVEKTGKGERVLIVDDEPMLRDLAAGMLQPLGYQVACVASGEAAVDYVETHAVDLVVLDMLMNPGINGLETYRRILALRPGQKAIIASGFSENQDVQAARALGAEGFVKKPYTLEELGNAVRRALDR